MFALIWLSWLPHVMCFIPLHRVYFDITLNGGILILYLFKSTEKTRSTSVCIKASNLEKIARHYPSFLEITLFSGSLFKLPFFRFLFLPCLKYVSPWIMHYYTHKCKAVSLMFELWSCEVYEHSAFDHIVWKCLLHALQIFSKKTAIYYFPW